MKIAERSWVTKSLQITVAQRTDYTLCIYVFRCYFISNSTYLYIFWTLGQKLFAYRLRNIVNNSCGLYVT